MAKKMVKKTSLKEALGLNEAKRVKLSKLPAEAKAAFTSGAVEEPGEMVYTVGSDGSVMGSHPDDYGETAVLWHSGTNELYFAELGWETSDGNPFPEDTDDYFDRISFD